LSKEQNGNRWGPGALGGKSCGQARIGKWFNFFQQRLTHRSSRKGVGSHEAYVGGGGTVG